MDDNTENAQVEGLNASGPADGNGLTDAPVEGSAGEAVETTDAAIAGLTPNGDVETGQNDEAMTQEQHDAAVVAETLSVPDPIPDDEMVEETDFSEGEPKAAGPEVPEGMVAITVTKSASDPVPVYVNGVGPYKLFRDKEQIVPEDVYDALANSGVEFEHRLAGE